MKTLIEIFNNHLDNGRKVLSYEHPGCGMIKNQVMREIADELVYYLLRGELYSDDLHVRINYNKPTSSQGNRKLKGIIYMASHPLIDCYLDGLNRQQPSCTGLNNWCYVFRDFFYKSFGKQLSMFRNSLLYILDPKRAEQEICDWIDTNMHKFVPDSHGEVAFRTDEAGDFTYCLSMWLNIVERYAGTNLKFYGYTKQFDLINTVQYNINTTHDNFEILVSDSTKDDPNPVTKLRENYGSFGINFRDPELTPDRVKALVNSPNSNRFRCPGAKAGCFHCAKCPRNENQHLFCEEH